MPNPACTQARQNPHLQLIEKLEKVWPWCSWLCSSHNSCRCCNWRCHCEHLCQILRTRYTRTRVICYAFLLLSCNVLFVQWTFDLIDWHYTHDLCTFRQKTVSLNIKAITLLSVITSLFSLRIMVLSILLFLLCVKGFITVQKALGSPFASSHLLLVYLQINFLLNDEFLFRCSLYICQSTGLFVV